MNRPIITHTRPEDYHAALLRIIADASAITQEVLIVLAQRNLDPMALSITVREIDMQLSRLKNELASGIEQMERLTFVADDLYTMYNSALDQRNLLLTWLAVQSRLGEDHG
jgi:uncharacterized membrane protein YccC